MYKIVLLQNDCYSKALTSNNLHILIKQNTYFKANQQVLAVKGSVFLSRFCLNFCVCMYAQFRWVATILAVNVCERIRIA